MSDALLSPETISGSDTDWREQYLGADKCRFARLSAKNSGGKDIPYGNWMRRCVDAPGHRLDDHGWPLERHRLRRHMEGGGVAVIVGETRAGKSCLLESLPLKIIDNSKVLEDGRISYRRHAPLGLDDIPSAGLFAIDETASHDPVDVLRVLDDPAIRRRGFALVFQAPESFRNYDIWPFLAGRDVLILEMTRR